MSTGQNLESSGCITLDAAHQGTAEQRERLIEGDDALVSHHPAEIKLLEIVDQIIEHDRRADILHIVPKKYHGCKEIVLYDDLETFLIQDCVCIDRLVSKLLNDYTVKRKHERDDSTECAICTEELSGKQFTRRLPCGHAYHCRCLRKSLILGSNYKCPLCRHDLLKDYFKDNLSPQTENILERDDIHIIAHALIARNDSSRAVSS